MIERKNRLPAISAVVMNNPCNLMPCIDWIYPLILAPFWIDAYGRACITVCNVLSCHTHTDWSMKRGSKVNQCIIIGFSEGELQNKVSSETGGHCDWMAVCDSLYDRQLVRKRQRGTRHCKTVCVTGCSDIASEDDEAWRWGQCDWMAVCDSFLDRQLVRMRQRFSLSAEPPSAI